MDFRVNDYQSDELTLVLSNREVDKFGLKNGLILSGLPDYKVESGSYEVNIGEQFTRNIEMNTGKENGWFFTEITDKETGQQILRVERLQRVTRYDVYRELIRNFKNL